MADPDWGRLRGDAGASAGKREADGEPLTSICEDDALPDLLRLSELRRLLLLAMGLCVTASRMAGGVGAPNPFCRGWVEDRLPSCLLSGRVAAPESGRCGSEMASRSRSVTAGRGAIASCSVVPLRRVIWDVSPDFAVAESSWVEVQSEY